MIKERRERDAGREKRVRFVARTTIAVGTLLCRLVGSWAFIIFPGPCYQLLGRATQGMGMKFRQWLTASSQGSLVQSTAPLSLLLHPQFKLFSGKGVPLNVPTWERGNKLLPIYILVPPSPFPSGSFSSHFGSSRRREET